MDKLGIDQLKNVPSGLSSLESKVDKLDTGNFKTTPVDLSKLSKVVKNDAFKKTEYNKLVTEVNNINTTDSNDLVKQLTATQKFMKLKIKILIMIMINILLLKNLIN